MTVLHDAETASGSALEETLVLTVRDRTQEADGIVALTLSTSTGEPLPAWAPGAHIELDLDCGLSRQYSLCSSPSDRSAWRIAVLREPEGRGGSAYVHDSLTTAVSVRANGPRNHFELQPATRYRFIAGGIGITPMLPMLRAAEAAGADWELLYGGRSRSSMAFLAELAEFGDRVRIQPQDEVGHPDIAGFIGEPSPDTLVYCCGPAGLLTAVETAMAACPDALHLERFAPKEREDTVETDTAFELEMTSSGVTVTVEPGQTIIEAAEAAGVPVVSSCGEGTCGTCETPIISGQADHRDSVLSPSEQATNTCLMICVSRALGPRLVLDM